MTDAPRLPKRMFVAAAVGAVILLSGAGVAVWIMDRSAEKAQDDDRIADLEASNDERNDDIGRLSDSLDATRSQLEALGVDPDAPPPAVIVGERGERGQTGPAPSAEQVQNAVGRYCEVNNCIGPEGPAPTAGQVAAAVAEYCDGRGQCTGPAGAVGAPGVDGAPGESITGPRGPGPTGEQITAAVEAYCAERNGCSGPPGADGEDSTVPGPRGEPGEPGPACPDGAEEIPWLVDEARSVVVGLPPDTYVLCRAAAT